MQHTQIAVEFYLAKVYDHSTLGACEVSDSLKQRRRFGGSTYGERTWDCNRATRKVSAAQQSSMSWPHLMPESTAIMPQQSKLIERNSSLGRISLSNGVYITVNQMMKVVKIPV